MAPRFLACFGRGGASSSSSSSPAETAATSDLTAEEQRRCGPILVELFSSQGCATSPQAELLLSRLGRGDFHSAQEQNNGEEEEDVGREKSLPSVVVLAFHVDYWDYMGWKDPFASSSWTVRQKAYVESLRLDALYTPQVVVHGRAQAAGTDEAEILSAVRSSPRFPSPTFHASFEKPSQETLRISLHGQLRTKVDGGGADIMLALYENGLITDCGKGENRGRVLSNDFVVRRMEKLCRVKDISAKKTLSGAVAFALWQGFNSAKCGVVVFAQTSSQHISGVQHFNLPDVL